MFKKGKKKTKEHVLWNLNLKTLYVHVKMNLLWNWTLF